MSVKRIAATLGVAVSSVSVWVRDVPLTDEQRHRLTRRTRRPRPTRPPREQVAGERRCGRCGEVLPLMAFNRAGQGHQHWCRECFRAYFRQRGQVHLQQVKKSRAARRETARAFIVDYLARGGCRDCGESDLLVLEFDHVGEKRDDVARLVAAGVSPAGLARELEQCEVVCVNCHRRRTLSRLGSYRVTGSGRRTWGRAQYRNAFILVEELRSRGCRDCGERDPAVLDFDHRGDKAANVSTLAASASERRLLAEVAKCDVRCGNCHRRRTLREHGCYRAAALESSEPP
jgi:hypothetical protein